MQQQEIKSESQQQPPVAPLPLMHQQQSMSFGQWLCCIYCSPLHAELLCCRSCVAPPNINTSSETLQLFYKRPFCQFWPVGLVVWSLILTITITGVGVHHMPLVPDDVKVAGFGERFAMFANALLYMTMFSTVFFVVSYIGYRRTMGQDHQEIATAMNEGYSYYSFMSTSRMASNSVCISTLVMGLVLGFDLTVLVWYGLLRCYKWIYPDADLDTASSRVSPIWLLFIIGIVFVCGTIASIVICSGPCYLYGKMRLSWQQFQTATRSAAVAPVSHQNTMPTLSQRAVVTSNRDGVVQMQVMSVVPQVRTQSDRMAFASSEQPSVSDFVASFSGQSQVKIAEHVTVHLYDNE